MFRGRGGMGGIDSFGDGLPRADTSIGLRASLTSRNRRTVASARFLDSSSGGGGGFTVSLGLLGEPTSPNSDFQAIDLRDSNWRVRGCQMLTDEGADRRSNVPQSEQMLI